LKLKLKKIIEEREKSFKVDTEEVGIVWLPKKGARMNGNTVFVFDWVIEGNDKLQAFLEFDKEVDKVIAETNPVLETLQEILEVLKQIADCALNTTRNNNK